MLAFAVAVVVRAGTIGLLILPTIAHELVTAVLFLVRRPARRTHPAARAQVVAYAAAFMVPAFVAAANEWRPLWIAQSGYDSLIAVGAFLWLFGALYGMWALPLMRRSFSVVPAARHLVTDGPYALARHPIYAAYIIQYLGLLVSHPTPQLAAVLAAWMALLIVRARYEEEVLGAAFPEYAAYRARTGMFWPRLRRRRADGGGG
jgi:protein-S-isoprenylcysteine O-methyltransferase Ste14